MCTSRVLGFRRAFPVTGRIVNMTSEIFNICGKELRNTFFTSLQPYNNMCFYGTCRRYCDIYHPVCGQNGLIEVRQLYITFLALSLYVYIYTLIIYRTLKFPCTHGSILHFQIGLWPFRYTDVVF